MRRTLRKLLTVWSYGVAARLCNAAGLMLTVVFLGTPAMAEVRILAFGDSLTQGYGLPEEEGFVPVLQAWLRANGADDVVVINGGVSGDTTAGGLSRIGWALGDDVDGVIVALGGNDLLRGLSPAEMRRNLDGILTEIDRKGLPVLLAGLPAPVNYGKDYAREFRQLYVDLAAEHGAILYPSFLAGMGKGRNMFQVMRLMQSDGIHPNAKGVQANVEAIGPAVLELVEMARR